MSLLLKSFLFNQSQKLGPWSPGKVHWQAALKDLYLYVVPLCNHVFWDAAEVVSARVKSPVSQREFTHMRAAQPPSQTHHRNILSPSKQNPPILSDPV